MSRLRAGDQSPQGRLQRRLFCFSENEAVASTVECGQYRRIRAGESLRQLLRCATNRQRLGNDGKPQRPAEARSTTRAEVVRDRSASGQYSPDLERSIWWRVIEGKALASVPSRTRMENSYRSANRRGEGGAAEGCSGAIAGSVAHVLVWDGIRLLPKVWAPGVGLGHLRIRRHRNTGPPREIDVNDNGEPISECVFGSAFEKGHSNFDAVERRRKDGRSSR